MKRSNPNPSPNPNPINDDDGHGFANLLPCADIVYYIMEFYYNLDDEPDRDIECRPVTNNEILKKVHNLLNILFPFVPPVDRRDQMIRLLYTRQRVDCTYIPRLMMPYFSETRDLTLGHDPEADSSPYECTCSADDDQQIIFCQCEYSRNAIDEENRRLVSTLEKVEKLYLRYGDFKMKNALLWRNLRSIRVCDNSHARIILSNASALIALARVEILELPGTTDSFHSDQPERNEQLFVSEDMRDQFDSFVMSNLHTLVLDHNYSPSIITMFGRSSSLTSLTIRSDYAPNDELFRHFHSLKELIYDGDSHHMKFVGQDMIDVIAPTLQRLVIYRTDETITTLSRLTNLTDLFVSSTRHVDSHLLAPLQHLKSLRLIQSYDNYPPGKILDLSVLSSNLEDFQLICHPSSIIYTPSHTLYKLKTLSIHSYKPSGIIPLSFIHALYNLEVLYLKNITIERVICDSYPIMANIRALYIEYENLCIRDYERTCPVLYSFPNLNLIHIKGLGQFYQEEMRYMILLHDIEVKRCSRSFLSNTPFIVKPLYHLDGTTDHWHDIDPQYSINISRRRENGKPW